MNCKQLLLAVLIIPLAVCTGFAASAPLSLTGWEIDHKNVDQFMAEAQAVGFSTLITWSTDPAVLKQDVAAGARHHIKIFAAISPMGGLGRLWRQRYPDRPIPWQVMNKDEQAACNFIMAGNNEYLIPYQFGGEPKLTNEVLGTKIICFNDLDARELFKPVIDGIVSVPGIEGLAFDGFGYQNYHCCYCPHCQALLAAYEKQHPEMSSSQAEVSFFRDTLVNYINYLADYARSKNPHIKTSIHVWPVFAPDPLYGNRLDVDYCGQTAAWYTIWPEKKIAQYSRIISGQAQKYYPRQQGVGMIGYYDRPGKFPVKSAAQVDLELKTMIDNGCRRIQVCGTSDVIHNQAIAAVFAKYFK